jgi:ribosomal protein S8
MSQDIVSDALNQIMNAKRAGKRAVSLNHHSKLLLSVLAIGKLRGYIRDYRITGTKLEIEFDDSLNDCRAIKPRYLVRAKNLMKYVRRYLPARNMGFVIISTGEGLITHHTAVEKNLGGSIIAYFY